MPLVHHVAPHTLPSRIGIDRCGPVGALSEVVLLIVCHIRHTQAGLQAFPAGVCESLMQFYRFVLALSLSRRLRRGGGFIRVSMHIRFRSLAMAAIIISGPPLHLRHADARVRRYLSTVSVPKKWVTAWTGAYSKNTGCCRRDMCATQSSPPPPSDQAERPALCALGHVGHAGARARARAGGDASRAETDTHTEADARDGLRLNRPSRPLSIPSLTSQSHDARPRV